MKLAGMRLDFGDDPARLGSASSLVGEIGMEPTHLVRRSPERALEQVLMQLIARQLKTPTSLSEMRGRAV
jgi:hypothetical protein